MAIRHLDPDKVTHVTETLRPKGRLALAERIRAARELIMEIYLPDDIKEQPSKVRTVVNLKELADDIEAYTKPAVFVFGDTVFAPDNRKALIVQVFEEAEQLLVIYEGESNAKLVPIADFRKTL